MVQMVLTWPQASLQSSGAARASVGGRRLRGVLVMPRTAAALIVVLLSVLVAAAPAGGQSEGTLRDRIGSGKQQERALASAAARLGQLERKVSREVAVLEGRL